MKMMNICFRIKSYLRINLWKIWDTNVPDIPSLNTSDTNFWKFILSPQEDDQIFQVRIVKMIYDPETNLGK